MGRYNLLKEKWISVSVDNKGYSEDVSLIEVFENADKYLDLAGNTKTQDFAVMRVLLAVLHTVFSRFDANGDPYPEVKLDDRYRQIDPIEDEDERLDYNDQLFETWKNLWNKGSFPNIVTDYLLKWEDHFNLFDEKYPFYQVLYEDISGDMITNKNPGKIYGKNINRLISQSQNKKSLFAPKEEETKDCMTYPEIVRWLITFQGYAGLADKTKFTRKVNKVSKGWLYDLGGIYFKGDNLFQSLMLNLVLDVGRIRDELENNIQRPCWEYSGLENINKNFRGVNPDNLSELYTNWARAINIEIDLEENAPFYLYAAKMQDLNHTSYFLEPMTIWNTKNKKDNSYKIKKHEANKALWRSFGLLVTDRPDDPEKGYKKPGLMVWLDKIKDIIGTYKLSIHSLSMQDDGNATSWKPTDQTYDSLSLDQFILTDLEKGNWTPRINDQVELTKKVIETDYKRFLGDLAFIRNNEGGGFVNKNIERMYFLIDGPFRDWLSSIKYDQDKEDKLIEWKKVLYKLVLGEAYRIVENSSPRDYMGRVEERKIRKAGRLENLATAFNRFNRSIISDLNIGGKI